MEEKTRKGQSVARFDGEKTSEYVDVNMVIGDKIVTQSGFCVIPFNKVTVGRLSGSGEYGETKVVNEDKTKAGASGMILNIKPEGFLVDDGTTVRLLNVTDDPMSALIEKAADLLAGELNKE